MNDINKRAQYHITVLLNLGFAPLYWALLTKFILFSIVAPHHLVWCLDDLYYPCYGRQQLRIDIQYLRTHLSQFGLLLLAAATY